MKRLGACLFLLFLVALAGPAGGEEAMMGGRGMMGDGGMMEGGSMMASGETGQPATTPKEVGAGESVFQQRCSMCHPDGGNIVKPDKPIRGSSKLKDLKTFVGYIRSPYAPMPAFPSSEISEEKARELYDYIVKDLNKGDGK